MATTPDANIRVKPVSAGRNRASGGRTKRSEANLRRLSASRVAIEAVSPEIDGGRFPAKTALGRPVRIEADIFRDGHDRIDAAILYRPAGAKRWSEAPMVYFDNDRWRGAFEVEKTVPYVFTLIAWKDVYASWRHDIEAKLHAGQSVATEIADARRMIARARAEPRSAEPAALDALAKLEAAFDTLADDEELIRLLCAPETEELYRLVGPRDGLTQYENILPVWVDRPAAEFGAWYELMPRSQSDDPARHGTFDDVIARLPYIRELGFDVLYMPPIHPIGRTNRKGRNNALTAGPDDPGSPYAIGSAEGGHDAIHPELGGFDDFARLVSEAAAHGLEVALDFAIQCSPDHPWIAEHPEWFEWRSDGTIRFAENPPKKYEDIVNVHFYGDALPDVWYALRDVVLFWAERGVRIFRVDNPHTKPLPFWEWMIAEIHASFPDVVFLAEAFTRPKMMKRLAKVGFTQSYSYFTWRNTKQELTEYLMELTQEECRHYMRPNFFVNTPDINPRYLQTSGRAGFRIRAVLAATLAGNYGIYSGFELCEAEALPGREEYANSEKYEIRAWDWDRPGHIRDDIARLNAIRRENAALHDFTNLAFFNAWDDNILYYGRRTADLESFVLVAVNLDPHGAHGADFEVPLWEFGLPDDARIGVEDLMTGDRFTWSGKIQHVHLDPHAQPFAVWRIFPEEAGA